MNDRILLGAGRERKQLLVHNKSAHIVRISSHFPFWRANRRLEFDRDAAKGFRLDIPAGGSVRFAPGETRRVVLVRYAGLEDGHG